MDLSEGEVDPTSFFLGNVKEEGDDKNNELIDNIFKLIVMILIIVAIILLNSTISSVRYNRLIKKSVCVVEEVRVDDDECLLGKCYKLRVQFRDEEKEKKYTDYTQTMYYNKLGAMDHIIEPEDTIPCYYDFNSEEAVLRKKNVMPVVLVKFLCILFSLVAAYFFHKYRTARKEWMEREQLEQQKANNLFQRAMNSTKNFNKKRQ
ncbi:hypothetical protein AKO1_012759 [Acrasis kona]|uniref:Uncharacterized protein n=1 Tax=Acrasis kona TaxID=1008807 RepID=A0AAW2YW91_9EUKA